jgi:hypothetical protein
MGNPPLLMQIEHTWDLRTDCKCLCYIQAPTPSCQAIEQKEGNEQGGCAKIEQNQRQQKASTIACLTRICMRSLSGNARKALRMHARMSAETRLWPTLANLYD